MGNKTATLPIRLMVTTFALCLVHSVASAQSAGNNQHHSSQKIPAGQEVLEGVIVVLPEGPGDGVSLAELGALPMQPVNGVQSNSTVVQFTPSAVDPERLILDIPAADIPRGNPSEGKSWYRKAVDQVGASIKVVGYKISGKNADGTEIDLTPPDKEKLTQLSDLTDEQKANFLEVFKSIMGKFMTLVKASHMPAEKGEALLNQVREQLWAAARVIATSDAHTKGIELSGFGGLGSGAWVRHILDQTVVGRLIPTTENWFFTAAGGLKILRVKNADGTMSSHVRFALNYSRSHQVSTIALGAGAEPLLVYEWLKKDANGNLPAWKPVNMTSLTLGALGVMSQGEGIFRIAINPANFAPPLHFTGAGGVSIPPMIGAVAVYASRTSYRTALSVNLSNFPSVGDALQAARTGTKRLFGSGIGMCKNALMK